MYRNGGEITHNYLKHIKKTVRQEIFEYLEKLPVNMEITVNGRQFILTHAAPAELYEDLTVVNMSVSETLPSGCDLTVSLFWRTVQSSSDTRQLSVSSMITQWQYGMQRAGSESTVAVCSLKRGDPWSGALGRLSCLRLDDMQVFYSEEPQYDNLKESEEQRYG